MLICFAPVILLRWFWWRINAWSEIAAITAAAVFSLAISTLDGWKGPEFFGHRVVTSMALTAVVWLPATFLTKPVDMETLKAFYLKVRPLGFWAPVRRNLTEEEARRRTDWAPWPVLAATCLLCVILIYGGIIAVGSLLLGRWPQGLVLVVICLVSWFFVRRQLGYMDAVGRREGETAARNGEA